MDFNFHNDLESILKWIPPESREEVTRIWHKNNKLGIVYITQHLPYETVYMTVAWCYSKAGIDCLPIHLQSGEKPHIEIREGFSIMAIRQIYGDAKKYADFVDSYVKNVIKTWLKKNGLFYDFEIEDILQAEPEMSLISDDSGKMAIIRLFRNLAVFVFEKFHRFTWIPDSMNLNFEAVQWAFDKEFKNILEVEKYIIMEDLK